MKLTIPVWLEILYYLKEGYTTISMVSKETKKTYANMHNAKLELLKVGLINEKRVGRTKILKLTAKGLNFTEHIGDFKWIKRILNESK